MDRPDLSAVPLLCNLCPNAPKFSDLSHLLTHIASKSHLSNRFKIQIQMQTNPNARAEILAFDSWYASNGIGELLAERMALKEHKKARNSRASMKTAATPTLEPILKQELAPAPNNDGNGLPFMYTWAAPRNAFENKSQSPNSFDGANGDSSYATPTNRRALPNFADYKFVDENEKQDSPAKFEPVEIRALVPDAAKLKGVMWPGMNLFDAATVDQQRKRNQRKDASVIERLELNSKGVESTEYIFNAAGELERSRDIYDESEYSSPDESEPIVPPSPPPIKTRVRAAKKPSGPLTNLNTNARLTRSKGKGRTGNLETTRKVNSRGKLLNQLKALPDSSQSISKPENTIKSRPIAEMGKKRKLTALFDGQGDSSDDEHIGPSEQLSRNDLSEINSRYKAKMTASASQTIQSPLNVARGSENRLLQENPFNYGHHGINQYVYTQSLGPVPSNDFRSRSGISQFDGPALTLNNQSGISTMVVNKGTNSAARNSNVPTSFLNATTQPPSVLRNELARPNTWNISMHENDSASSSQVNHAMSGVENVREKSRQLIPENNFFASDLTSPVFIRLHSKFLAPVDEFQTGLVPLMDLDVFHKFGGDLKAKTMCGYEVDWDVVPNHNFPGPIFMESPSRDSTMLSKSGRTSASETAGNASQDGDETSMSSSATPLDKCLTLFPPAYIDSDFKIKLGYSSTGMGGCISLIHTQFQDSGAFNSYLMPSHDGLMTNLDFQVLPSSNDHVLSSYDGLMSERSHELLPNLNNNMLPSYDGMLIASKLTNLHNLDDRSLPSYDALLNGAGGTTETLPRNVNGQSISTHNDFLSDFNGTTTLDGGETMFSDAESGLNGEKHTPASIRHFEEDYGDQSASETGH